MGNGRFFLLAIILMVGAFVGVSWASKGFPVMSVRVVPLKPDPRLPTFEESVKQGIRKDWENSKTSQSDGNKERDQLRLATLQAANAYALSPCDSTTRKNLIEAMTAYTVAWAEIAGCRNGSCSGDGGKKIQAARVAFTTPADIRVHEALRSAVEQGGIGRDDFPKSIRHWAMQWSGVPFDEPVACNAGRRAGNKAR
jgi:hypothetical protein